MLEQLFGSKARTKLLIFFLINNEKSYYIRELTRILRSQINSIRREIENLKNFGILTEGAKDLGQKDRKNFQQRKYFKANTNFILYDELKSLILKSQLMSRKNLIEKIIKSGNISYLVLTGFFVSSADSPTDILIVGKINKKIVNKIIGKLEKEFNKNINYTVISKTEFFYRKDITDKFLYNILEGKKIVIVDKLKK
ncbi:hypothetical protein KAI52_01455 [Candidatus Parcubacteria bacterium]|nr:hypothetical protein [Candidatus Parcubacteria bacterium]